METRVTPTQEIYGLFEYLHGQIIIKGIFPLVLLRCLAVQNESSVIQSCYLGLVLSLLIESSIQNMNYIIPNTQFWFKMIIMLLYMICHLTNVGTVIFLFEITNPLYFTIILWFVLIDSIILLCFYFLICILYLSISHREVNGTQDLGHIRVIKMLYGITRYNVNYESEK